MRSGLINIDHYDGDLMDMYIKPKSSEDGAFTC